MAHCRSHTNEAKHPAALPRTRRVVASQGLTPGLPLEFQYVEIAKNPTYVSEDAANYYINDEACIPQNYQKYPLPGEVPFVYDQPFDPLQDERKNKRLAVIGFGLMAMGGLLYGGLMVL